MCGIAGIINIRDGADRSVLEKASGLMAHRGPDDEGFFVEGEVGLAHRRLSIIDIGGGAQPMFNEDKGIVVVFNGEIYNFTELRGLLESKGHEFSTSSDTEVILHGYEEWGTDCVERFHGMFAFALFNRSDRSLFLSRDRCGEKPLYYYHDRGLFIFASEVQTLITILGHTPKPDPEAVSLYLHLGYIPAPRSFFTGIRKLQSGSWLAYRDGGLTCKTYYSPAAASCNGAGENELCDELDVVLQRAVKKMLVSDVPLGAFLSGGLDSSLIAAMMANEGRIPETFSISFSHDSFDESQYAQLASSSTGTRHTQYRVNFGDFEECLSIMDGFGEPFADSSGIPTYYLARETRKNVTVALSGDGGDELFGGYRRYVAQRLAEYYLQIPSPLRKGVIGKVLSFFPDKDVYYADSLINSARIFVSRAESIGVSSGLMLNTLFTHDELTSLFPDLPDGRKLIQESVGTLGGKNKVEDLMLVDRKLYLSDDILVKVDRMSMKNSLEVRPPFLDPDVLAVSERIPLSMKIRGMNQKYLLKKVALRYLPSRIVSRKKHGFMVPLAQWIRQAGEEDIRGRMPSQANTEAVNRLLQSHFRGNLDQSHKIFALIVLGRYSL